MLLTEIVEVKWRKDNKKYYEGKEYLFTKIGDEFNVFINDLPINSNKEIECTCDYCAENGIYKIINKKYKKYVSQREVIQKDCCLECAHVKQKEVCLLKYGVEYYSQLEESKTNIGNIKRKHNIEEVFQLFKDVGYELLTEEYINNEQHLQYICPIHGLKEISLGHFLMGKRCSECSHDRISEGQKLSQDYIETLFLERGYEVVSEYVNYKSPIQFICKKHSNKIQETSFGNFVNTKHCCCECYGENCSGENHWNWKGGGNSESMRARRTKEYKEWRKLIFERDNYTCQCCGDNKGHNLSAHHIKNFSDNEELRFDTDNGVTLCDKCHNPNQIGSFHNLYGTFNNTKEQLEEYISLHNPNN